MSLSTIVTMFIGTMIPLIIALITKQRLNAKFKVLLTLFFTTISGVLTSLLGAYPTSLTGWEHVLLNVLMTYLAAAGADVAGWIPSGAKKVVETATPEFGIGPKPVAFTPPADPGTTASAA